MVTLEQLVPKDHLLWLLNQHIQFDFIREATQHLYCEKPQQILANHPSNRQNARMIERSIFPDVQLALSRFPVVALIGPRQVGKTTLARQIQTCSQKNAVYLDLERPSDLAKLQDPELFLGAKREQLVILDEIQQLPDLFPVLRALVDEHRKPGRFLLLGSASPDILNRSSESLAGRIQFIEMTPLSLGEVRKIEPNLQGLWLRGGFPDSFLAADETASLVWRESFIRTYLERDIPNLGFKLPAQGVRRFWTMLAHWHGQLWNASALAKGLDISPQTANRYLDVLGDSFIARRLLPWTSNIGKRMVKSPRIFLRDTGLLHALLNIRDMDSLSGHPVLGASWEGFVLEQVLSTIQPQDAGFYRTAAGAEIDLVFLPKGKPDPIAIEVKYAAAPKLKRGFWEAMEDLKIKESYVIYPGEEPYPIEKRVTAWPAKQIPELIERVSV